MNEVQAAQNHSAPRANGSIRRAGTHTLMGLTLTGLVLAGLFLLIGRASPHHERADLRLIENVSIGTLDPAAISQLQDIRVALQVFEGLTAFNPEGAEPRKGCATGWTVDESKTNWEFRLRPEARWSNGDPVTAGDFLFAWRRAIEPGTAKDYAFFFELIAGVKEYVDWRHAEIARIAALPPDARPAARDAHLDESDRRFRETVALSAEGAHTLRMRLTRPVAYWLDLLSTPVFMPLHEATVRTFRVLDDSGHIFYDPRWLRPGVTLFNGPYILSNWRFKRSLTLRANPMHPDQAALRVRSVEILDVNDSNTAWLMYEDGRVDLLPSVKAVYTPELVERSNSPYPDALNRNIGGRDDIHAIGAFGTYFYNLNCQPRLPGGKPNPLAHPALRRAIAHAVDRVALCRGVLRQNETPADTLIPPDTIDGYPFIQGLPFDPAQAKAELAAAGYRSPNDVPELVISYNHESNHGLIAQTIESMLRKNLGIRVRTEGKESQTFNAAKQDHNFMIARASWYGDYGDPTTFLDVFTTGNGNNDSGYRDANYDGLLALAEKSDSPASRLRLLSKAEKRLMQETLPALPLYHDVNVYAFRPNQVRGMQLNPRLLIHYRDLEVRR